MRKPMYEALVALFSLMLSFTSISGAHAVIAKPSQPTVVSIKASAAKSGKVTITVSFALPNSLSGGAVTKSRVTAGGKSCIAKKKATSCKIYGIKKGKWVTVKVWTANKKGYGPSSKSIRYLAGTTYYATPTPSTTPSPTLAPALIPTF